MLKKSKQRLAYHLEFAFEIRGEDSLADVRVNIGELLPAALVDLVKVGMQFV